MLCLCILSVFFKKKLLFIYLAVPGLSCSIWTLSFGMWDPIPWPGIEPRPLHWEHRVLATGPQGKPLSFLFNSDFQSFHIGGVLKSLCSIMIISFLHVSFLLFIPVSVAVLDDKEGLCTVVGAPLSFDSEKTTLKLTSYVDRWQVCWSVCYVLTSLSNDVTNKALISKI